MPKSLLSLMLLIVPALAWANDGAHGASTFDLAAIGAILLLARLGGHLAIRVGQPGVVGELTIGMVAGLGFRLWAPELATITERPLLSGLAELGVILLLFEVGLESTIRQMLAVGPSAMLVALLGVIAPFFLGWGVTRLVLPDASLWVHVFAGAALTATSVGITARVLQDLGWSKHPVARVILGAAVIDDILGLLVLAAVSAVIASVGSGEAVELLPILMIVLKAAGFLVGGLAFGVVIVPRGFRVAAEMRGAGGLIVVSLAFCFLMSAAAGYVGLAPIVGAFAAGLVLEQVHYEPFIERGEHELEDLIRPITGWLAPLFFVSMGMRVDVRVFTDPSVLALAAGLIVAAVIGKQAAMLGVLDRRVPRTPVGIGMIPRGEVGLIFANIGLGLRVAGQPVVDERMFGALIATVIITTVMTPPLLARALAGLDPLAFEDDEAAHVEEAAAQEA